MPLNPLEARAAKPKDKSYKLSDGRGLYLLVRPSGDKVWRCDYIAGGQRKTAAFGCFPELSITGAREKREALRSSVKAAAAPMDGKTRTETFKVVAERWFEGRKTVLSEEYAARVWLRLEQDVLPHIGKRPINEITAPDVLAALRLVEGRSAIEAAKRIRQYVSNIFALAIAEGLCAFNPAGDLAPALKPKPRVKHRSAMRLDQMTDFMARLRSVTDTQAKRALQLVLYTVARTDEIRFAKWSEFEALEGPEPIWRLPADRMKMGREHIIPLSKQALRTLEAIREEGQTGNLLFASDTRSGVISENAMLTILYNNGFYGKATVHGFRTTFSTAANESGKWNRDWIEMALAHGDCDAVRGAYNAAEYMTQRRELLQWWGNLLEAKEAEGFI
ncbi:MAG: tyrosine-type recombinase/integrase [Rhizomicrobium sp.]|nr:tyrosine-type recombinase/integrase [Rhizomicrobium sp.]